VKFTNNQQLQPFLALPNICYLGKNILSTIEKTEDIFHSVVVHILHFRKRTTAFWYFIKSEKKKDFNSNRFTDYRYP